MSAQYPHRLPTTSSATPWPETLSQDCGRFAAWAVSVEPKYRPCPNQAVAGSARQPAGTSTRLRNRRGASACYELRMSPRFVGTPWAGLWLDPLTGASPGCSPLITRRSQVQILPPLPSLKPCNCAGLYSCVAAPKLAVIWGKSPRPANAPMPTHQHTGGNRAARVHTGTIGRYSWQADLAAHSRATTPATSSWGCSRSEPLTPASSSLAYTRGIWTLVARVALISRRTSKTLHLSNVGVRHSRSNGVIAERGIRAKGR